MGAVCCGGIEDSDDAKAKRFALANKLGPIGQGTMNAITDEVYSSAGPTGKIGITKMESKKLVYVAGMGLVSEASAMLDLTYRQKAISSRSLKGPPKADPKNFCKDCKRLKSECVCGLSDDEINAKKKAEKMKRSMSSRNVQSGVYSPEKAAHPMEARTGSLEYEKVNKDTEGAKTSLKRGGSARWGNGNKPGQSGQKAGAVSAATTPRKKRLGSLG